MRAEETFPETSAYEELVTVVGTKTERSIGQIGIAFSMIDRERTERLMSRGIADIFRYERGVSVAGTGSRFGLTGYFDLSNAATLNIGLFNLLDKRYIRWADTESIGNEALSLRVSR